MTLNEYGMVYGGSCYVHQSRRMCLSTENHLLCNNSTLRMKVLIVNTQKILQRNKSHARASYHKHKYSHRHASEKRKLSEDVEWTFFSQKWRNHPFYLICNHRPTSHKQETHSMQFYIHFHSLSRVFFLLPSLFKLAVDWRVSSRRRKRFFFFRKKGINFPFYRRRFEGKEEKKLSLFRTHTAEYRTSMSSFLLFRELPWENEQFRSHAFVFSFWVLNCDEFFFFFNGFNYFLIDFLLSFNLLPSSCCLLYNQL